MSSKTSPVERLPNNGSSQMRSAQFARALKASQEATLSAQHIFNNVDYSLTITLRPRDGDSSIAIDLQDSSTTECWSANFDATQIEEMTQKTGNYKHFGVFVNMLEAALNRTSESVQLDLLTYADLESLRRQRGFSSRSVEQPTAINVPPNSNKRYLILTYTAQFDRIHYPLPLSYIGKPDPRELMSRVRDLESQLRANNLFTPAFTANQVQHADMKRMQETIATLRYERENLLHEVVKLRRQIVCPSSAREVLTRIFSPPPAAAALGAGGAERLQADGGGTLAGAGARTSSAHVPHDAAGGADAEPLGEPEARARAADSGSASNPTVLAVRREIRSLRQVIRSLEEELLKQKNEHQRTLQKRSGEYRSLVDEIEVLRANERRLKLKLKITADELSRYKRMAIFSRSFAVGGTAFNMMAGLEGMSRPRSASFSRNDTGNAVRSVSRSPAGARTPTGRDPSPFARSSRSGSGSRAPSLERERNRPPSAGSTGSASRTGHQSRRAFPSKAVSGGSAVPFSRRTPSNSLERGNPRRITPSPTSVMVLPPKRFDPVKFVREQEEKRVASLQNKKREITSKMGSISPSFDRGLRPRLSPASMRRNSSPSFSLPPNLDLHPNSNGNQKFADAEPADHHRESSAESHSSRFSIPSPTLDSEEERIRRRGRADVDDRETSASCSLQVSGNGTRGSSGEEQPAPERKPSIRGSERDSPDGCRHQASVPDSAQMADIDSRLKRLKLLMQQHLQIH